jgi:hypothetical protein
MVWLVGKGYFDRHGDFKDMHVMIPHMETPEVKAGRLKWMQIQGYLRCYLRPRRLLKLFSSAYILKIFAGSLGNYIAITAGYYARKVGNQPHYCASPGACFQGNPRFFQSFHYSRSRLASIQ